MAFGGDGQTAFNSETSRPSRSRHDLLELRRDPVSAGANTENEKSHPIHSRVRQ